MHPYCISILQKLQPADFEKCNFCSWFRPIWRQHRGAAYHILLQIRHDFTCLAVLIVRTIESGLRITNTSFNVRQSVYGLQSRNIELLDQFFTNKLRIVKNISASLQISLRYSIILGKNRRVGSNKSMQRGLYLIRR